MRFIYLFLQLMWSLLKFWLSKKHNPRQVPIFAYISINMFRIESITFKCNSWWKPDALAVEIRKHWENYRRGKRRLIQRCQRDTVNQIDALCSMLFSAFWYFFFGCDRSCGRCIVSYYNLRRWNAWYGRMWLMLWLLGRYYWGGDYWRFVKVVRLPTNAIFTGMNYLYVR